MRPLRDAPLSRVHRIVFDLDDTLTRDGVLEGPALQALYRARSAGIGLILVTGRPLGWADVLASLLPVDFVVGENGAGWVIPEGRALREGYFADTRQRAEHRETLERVRIRVAKALPHVRQASDQRARRCDLAFDVGERERLSPGDTRSLIELIRAEGAKTIVSSVHAHAVPGEWDKAAGVCRAHEDAAGRALDLERAAFVGDSPNDEAAFRAFPISVGVANVRDHLDRLDSPPSFVTEADRGLGFQELVDRILEAR